MSDPAYDTIEQILRDRFALMGAEYDAADLDSAVTDTIEGLEAAGLVIVPETPIEEMVLHAAPAANLPQRAEIESNYRAMIAARPKGGDSE